MRSSILTNCRLENHSPPRGGSFKLSCLLQLGVEGWGGGTLSAALGAGVDELGARELEFLFVHKKGGSSGSVWSKGFFARRSEARGDEHAKGCSAVFRDKRSPPPYLLNSQESVVLGESLGSRWSSSL